MRTFPLQIVTPKGIAFNGKARSVSVRTAAGGVGILAGHADYTAPLSKGTARVVDENGNAKTAVCGGGILNVSDGEVRVITDEFEWSGDIK